MLRKTIDYVEIGDAILQYIKHRDVSKSYTVHELSIALNKSISHLTGALFALEQRGLVTKAIPYRQMVQWRVKQS
jgi:DNA-binding transcriptional ArsR family regulator